MNNQSKQSQKNTNSEENYIVRIYRMPEKATQSKDSEMVGLVEDVEHGRCATFHTIDELWAIISK